MVSKNLTDIIATENSETPNMKKLLHIPDIVCYDIYRNNIWYAQGGCL